jgi:hypothetical protein
MKKLTIGHTLIETLKAGSSGCDIFWVGVIRKFS